MNSTASQFARLDYSVRRYFIDQFYTRHLSQMSAGIRVLDLGGTKIHKRGRFNIEHYPLNVFYLNLTTIKTPDIQADAAYLPFKDQCFDVVICSEMLEHVLNPADVLNETYRTLCYSGTVLVCVPFLYRIHGDPFDYGRYTDTYWHHILQEIGFREIIIEPQGFFFSVLADFGKQYLSEIRVHPLFYRLTRWLMRHFQLWAMKHEQRPHIKSQPFINSFTTGYGIVATK